MFTSEWFHNIKHNFDSLSDTNIKWKQCSNIYNYIPYYEIGILRLSRIIQNVHFTRVYTQ